MNIRLKIKILYIFDRSFRCGLQQGGKYCSLKFVVQKIESWKVHQTLRSAERRPTLSAGRKPDKPFSNWRGVLLMIKTLLYIAIKFLHLTKVDRHMSRGKREKCPEHL
jgi:hypothetical protein